MTLPLFLTPSWKLRAGLTVFILASCLYMATNHYPVFTPRYLPTTAIDHAVPFVPWTVLVYTSEYFFFPAVFLTCRDMENLNKWLYSFFACQFFSCVIFFFFPTTFPRDLYPIPADTAPFLKWVWVNLRESDSPLNCFPSLHVSTVYLSAYIFLDEQKGKFPLFFVWGTLIALSTLPTKQHYMVDVVAGWSLSVIFYWVFHRWMKYRRVGPLALAYSSRPPHQANR